MSQGYQDYNNWRELLEAMSQTFQLSWSKTIFLDLNTVPLLQCNWSSKSFCSHPVLISIKLTWSNCVLKLICNQMDKAAKMVNTMMCSFACTNCLQYAKLLNWTFASMTLMSQCCKCLLLKYTKYFGNICKKVIWMFPVI